MTLAILLIAAAAPAGAQASALATVRILPGERISLTAPRPAADRQLRVSRRADGGGKPIDRRLVEFQ